MTDFNVADAPTTAETSTQPTASGFAKYLAFMRREKRGGRSRAGTSTSHASGSGSTGREQAGPPV
jgi:hypothetical protein